MRLSLLFLILVGGSCFALDSPRPALLLVQDQPWAAWVEGSGEVTVGRAARWDGAQWRPLGGALNTDPALTVASVALALAPDGRVWAAWGEKPPRLTGKDVGSGRLHVAFWTGQSWKEPAPSPSRSDRTVSDRPVLRVDASGRPWVLWSEITPDFNVENVYLAVLQDGGWRLVDNGSLTTDVSSASRSRDLALTAAGVPVLAYSKLIYKHDFQVFVGPWSGQRWEPLAGARNPDADTWAGFPSLALDALGNPTVAFVQGGGFRLVVQQHRGAGWMTLGAPGNPGARGPRLALDGKDSPVAAWIEPGGLRASRWTGVWQDYPGPVSTPGAFVDTADLQLDSSGRPWLFWAEDDTRGQRLVLRRWDEGWATFPPPPFAEGRSP